jgi:acetyl-CoA C-acetyltransferase
MSKDIVIVAAKRTPMGGFQGVFSTESAPQLGATAIQSVIQSVGLDASTVDEVYFGNVISAGIGQAPARQASLKAGLSIATPCTTVSKVCGSGMKAVMLAADALQLGAAKVVVAGGMESMSSAPYLLDKARAGHRLGHQVTKDSMFVDGLEDADTGRLMGEFGQATADRFEFSRQDMDAFAIESLRRAQRAIDEGLFRNEVAPHTVSTRKGDIVVEHDEQPGNANPEKIPLLKPAFKKDGSVTAANSSSISDGAAALVLMSREVAQEQGLAPLAVIRGQASHAQAPEEFTMAPVGAIQKVLDQADWSAEEVDLFEINEAFAVVTMLAMREFNLDHSKVNVHGGACALGHPLGASGARILVTLIHALKQYGKTKGIASLCIGGGEATAMAIEIL